MAKHKHKHKHTRTHRPADPPGEFITVYAPVWLASALKAEADARRRSVSYVVVDALIDYFGIASMLPGLPGRTRSTP